MPRLFFEDFTPGSVATVSGPTVTKDDILAFAREFDPQPFHIDEEAAKASFVGGLIASGWHTCALTMRMVADGFLQNTSGMGAPGIEEVKWQTSVRPGDTLSLRRTVLETRESRSRPEMGLVRILSEVLNQAGEIVMTQVNWTMFGRRHAGPASAPEIGERS
jgi:acyl dehydratase